MLAELLKGFSHVTVAPVENRFFGNAVTVAGLLTGSCLLHGLQGKGLGELLLIPSSMLRRGEDVFLDGMTVPELSEKLGVPVAAVEPDAESLYREISSPASGGGR
jgi:NifB/MoaA-like Fe-S oxidoreductase